MSIPAFSLIEMVAVIAILVTLMTAGVSLLRDNGVQSRRAGTDLLVGLVEQARTTAISSRTDVVLAIAEPGDLPTGDDRCRVGMFKVPQWPSASTETMVLENCVLLSRWQLLNTGVVLIPGVTPAFEGLENPLDEKLQATIQYGTGNRAVTTTVHLLAFNSRGGLKYPVGSQSVILRVAEGAYRGGKPKANIRAGRKQPAENIIKIGRVTARPYRIDG